MEYSVDLDVFGNWLRERREFKRLTQDQAAKKAKITRVRWNQIEQGKGKEPPLRETVERVVKAVDASLGHALELLRYPTNEVERAYQIEGGRNRLKRAVDSFKEILLHSESETEAAILLMDLYRRYHDYKLSSEVKSALDPFRYQRALLAVVESDPLHQWFLAREVISYLWKSGRMPCFPEVPEFKKFNQEQTRILRIAAQQIKEKRIEASLRDRTMLDEYRKTTRRQRNKRL